MNDSVHRVDRLVTHAELPAVYGPGLRSIMKRPERFLPDDEAILTERLIHEDGHLRLPALAGYMRESEAGPMCAA